MRKIGMTTSIPVEAVFAAGCVPVDLNNVFINSPDPSALVAEAEYAGYPRNACGWIKGIYSVAARGDVDAVVAVVEGDCSQTQAMVETLQERGMEIIPFSYPYGRDRDMLRLQIEKLIERLGTTWADTLEWKRRLDEIRRKVRKLDELTWQRGTIGSFENHYYQVCCSDFNGDPDAFEREVDKMLREALCPEASSTGLRPDSGLGFPNPSSGLRFDSGLGFPNPDPCLRLGYIGVPPIYSDFYDAIESMRARVVFNEVQRQFAMPNETDDLVEQYALYTYPYDVFARIADIKREVERRSIRGLIHYTQSFCFRQIQDLIIRRHIDIPILTIEGDTPMPLDARTRVRIESFMEMLG
jgi:benzoyl-CoA reductase/2-hydroxyglutaryl-CoA dehydratase subunit BcrC/BadD/HgdB